MTASTSVARSALSTEIVAASWQDDRRCWRLRDADGTEYEANVLVSAIGLFHTPAIPDLPGLGDFTGTVFHSARWDHDHDLTGRRVAVIGTGASAIQVVPAIAERDRAPRWCTSGRRRGSCPGRTRRSPRNSSVRSPRTPKLALRHRTELYELFEQNIAFIAGPDRRSAGRDRAGATSSARSRTQRCGRSSRPDYPIGCKRVLVSSDFYPAVQRDDVELVTDRIERITSTGIRTADGTERAVRHDRAVHRVPRHRVPARHRRHRTRGHEHPRPLGRRAPRAYHGMAVPGFPNFFLLYGPNTNQGGNSIILILEAQAHFVALAIQTMREQRMSSVEVRPEAMQRYVIDLKLALDGTVWSGACDSYFRTPGGEIVTQLPHTSSWYRDRTQRFDPDDFAMRTSDAIR